MIRPSCSTSTVRSTCAGKFLGVEAVHVVRGETKYDLTVESDVLVLSLASNALCMKYGVGTMPECLDSTGY